MTEAARWKLGWIGFHLESQPLSQQRSQLLVQTNGSKCFGQRSKLAGLRVDGVICDIAQLLKRVREPFIHNGLLFFHLCRLFQTFPSRSDNPAR